MDSLLLRHTTGDEESDLDKAASAYMTGIMEVADRVYGEAELAQWSPEERRVMLCQIAVSGLVNASTTLATIPRIIEGICMGIGGVIAQLKPDEKTAAVGAINIGINKGIRLATREAASG